MRPVDAPFAGNYDGIAQNLNLGSYIDIDASASLDSLQSFTVGAVVEPELQSGKRGTADHLPRLGTAPFLCRR